MKDESKNIKEILYLGVVDMNHEGVDFALMFKCPAHKYMPTLNLLMNVA